MDFPLALMEVEILFFFFFKKRKDWERTAGIWITSTKQRLAQNEKRK